MRDAFARWADPALTLTVGGVGITIAAPTIRNGLRLKAMYANLLHGESADLPNLPELLGLDTHPDAQQLTPGELQHLANTAAAWFGAGPKLAEHVWHGLDPNRDTPEPEDDEDHLILGRWGWYDPRPGAYGPDDPGGGDWNPHTEYRLWYNDAPAPDAAPAGMTWAQMLDHWHSVECDLQQHYGIDLDEVADTRSIVWLEARLAGLSDIEGARLRALLAGENH